MKIFEESTRIMSEDFVTYELAVKLKEKGYPQDVFIGYDEFGALCIGDEHSLVCDAPTIWHVLKWLRNTHNLHVETYPCGLGMWKFLVTNIITLEERALCDKYTSSEQADLAGIEHVLDNLI